MPNMYDASDEAGGRGGRALELHLKGIDTAAIAERLGYSDVKHVHRAIKLAKARVPKKELAE